MDNNEEQSNFGTLFYEVCAGIAVTAVIIAVLKAFF
jgi:hypothetical protein